MNLEKNVLKLLKKIAETSSRLGNSTGLAKRDAKKPRKRQRKKNTRKKGKPESSTQQNAVNQANTGIVPFIGVTHKSSEPVNIAIQQKNKEIDELKNKEIDNIKKSLSELEKYKLDEQQRNLQLATTMMTPMLTFMKEKQPDLGGQQLENISQKIDSLEERMYEAIEDYKNDKSDFVTKAYIEEIKNDPNSSVLSPGEDQDEPINKEEIFVNWLTYANRDLLYKAIKSFDDGQILRMFDRVKTNKHGEFTGFYVPSRFKREELLDLIKTNETWNEDFLEYVVNTIIEKTQSE